MANSLAKAAPWNRRRGGTVENPYKWLLTKCPRCGWYKSVGAVKTLRSRFREGGMLREYYCPICNSTYYFKFYKKYRHGKVVAV